jgi:uncharacterized protein YukE
MANREIAIKISGDASGFNSAVGGAVQKTESLSSRLKGVGKGMVIGAGIGAFNLLNDAVSFGIGQIGAMDQKYKDFQASQTKLTVALKNNIPGWDGNAKGAEAFAEAQKRLGFNATEVQDSLGQLVGVTHNLAEAQQLASLAEDLARSKGIDLATATDVVTKAHEGNGRALKGYGIDIGNATTATELLDAVTKNVTTPAEAYAGTSEGKTVVANASVEASMVKIGAIIDKVAVVVLPMLAQGFEYLADIAGAVFPVIGRIVDAAQKIIVGAIKAIIGIVSTVIGVFQGMAGIIGGIWAGVTSTIKGAINFIIDTINGAIRGINKIQVHIAVGPVKYDFNGVNLGYIPRLHSGGIVPGVPGTEQLTMLQAGERVTPAGSSSGFTIQGVSEAQIIDMVDRGLYFRLQRAAPTLGRT